MKEAGIARKAAAYFGHRLREIAIYPQILRSRSRPRIIFFPSSTREGASLLRAYLISEYLSTHGWNSITVPAQLELKQRERVVKLFDPDLIFFQQCRHSYNDSLFSFGRKFVLDIDDADFLDPNLQDKLARTCTEASGVIAGSRFVRDWCVDHNPNTTVIWTSTPETSGVRPDHAQRGPVIAWAQSSPIGYHQELEYVRDFCSRMRKASNKFTLRLYGVSSDEERNYLRAYFGKEQGLELFPLLIYDRFVRSLYDVSVGLSPIVYASGFSRGKSFGKILCYLDAKVPVIASDEADHRLFFSDESAIISNDSNKWVEGAAKLLDSPRTRNLMADKAFQLFRARLTTPVAASKVAKFLHPLV